MTRLTRATAGDKNNKSDLFFFIIGLKLSLKKKIRN
jgi:hypothetical protein